MGSPESTNGKLVPEAGLLGAISSAVIATDPQGYICFWNAAAETLYCTLAADAMDRHLLDVITVRATPEEGTEIVEAMTAGRSWTGMFLVTRPDGTEFWVRVVDSPLFDADGQLSAIVGVSDDVTAEVEANEEARHLAAVVSSSLQRAEDDRARLDEAQRIAGIGHFEVDPRDPSNRTATCSPQLFTMLGIDPVPPEQLLWRYFECCHPDDRELGQTMAARAFAGEQVECLHRIVRPDGSTRWMVLRCRPREAIAPSGPYQQVPVLGTILDVTDRVLAEDRRRLAEERFRLGFERSAVGAALLDLQGRFTLANPAMGKLTGRAESDLVGVTIQSVLVPDEHIDPVEEALAPPGSHHEAGTERCLARPDGSDAWAQIDITVVRDDAGEPLYLFAQALDITERRTAQAALEHLALHDPLTRLPNRTLLLDRMEQALVTRDHNLALAFVDLDHFKLVNDSLGHTAGDQLLVAVAERLSHVARRGDTVARFGGDEFVVLCPEVDGRLVGQLGERLLRALDGPFHLGDEELYVTASVGIALGSPDVDPQALLRDADTAMYRAKDRGRARVEIFDRTLRARAKQRLRLESGLHKALLRDELEVWYQPIVDLSTGAVPALEALLRWNHPKRGVVPPGQFVELAEDTALIVPIGEWVLERALFDLAALHRELGESTLKVSVNLSARQVLTGDLVGTVARALHNAGVAPRHLGLELTETALVADTLTAERVLYELTQHGVSISLDDFGTGYSSLGYLQRFPISSLKIDQSFVAGLGTDPHDSLVDAIVGLARALRLTIVAEGVETLYQFSHLRQAGCQWGQGHLWSPAVPVGRLPELLRTTAAQPRQLDMTEVGDVSAALRGTER